MHVLANWIAKLVQFLYCSIIYHADCNSGPFCTFKWTFLCSLVDLFVHCSGPFGGPCSDWGVLQSPENTPGYGLVVRVCIGSIQDFLKLVGGGGGGVEY